MWRRELWGLSWPIPACGGKRKRRRHHVSLAVATARGWAEWRQATIAALRFDTLPAIEKSASLEVR